MVSTRNKKEIGSSSQTPESTSVSSSDVAASQPPVTSPNAKQSRKARRSSSRSSSSSKESDKSDSSARKKMKKAKLEEEASEVGRRTPNKDSHSSDTANDEMIDVRSGELSPNSKGRKRIHDEIAKGGNDSTNVPDDVEDRPPSRAANGEPLGKKIRETPSPPREEIEKGSTDDQANNEAKTGGFKAISKLGGGGFSNTSAVSPFGALGVNSGNENGEKSGETKKSSAFESSGFSSFSKSTSAFGVTPAPLAASPFGAAPTGSGNVFSTMSASTAASPFGGPPVGSANVFAQMSGNIGGAPSGFGASKPSGFGGVALPFGAQGTSIFGKPNNAPIPKIQPLESLKPLEKPTKAENKDDDSGDDGEEAEPSNEDDSKPQTENAPKPIALKSGEEGYSSVFLARGKLFEFLGTKDGWKERGIGNVKVLIPEDIFGSDDKSDTATKKPTVGRIVMRQEGVGRLILNANLTGVVLSERKGAENTAQFGAVNSVILADAQEKEGSQKDGKQKEADQKLEEQKDEEGANFPAKKSESNQAESTEPRLLRSYLLRFKSSDLAKEFTASIRDNRPPGKQ